MIDQNLKQFASETQWRHYVALHEHGSQRKAAEAIGVTKTAIGASVERLKKAAAIRGYAPEHDMTHTTPESHRVKGVSTLYKGTEADPYAMQWVKTDVAREQAEAATLKAIEAACEGIKPVKPKAAPKATVSDLATLYTITDFHLGMYAWGKETGGDWDIKIAEQVLVNAISDMAAGSPNSEVGIFCQLGDFLHWDGLDAVTPANKNILEADTRYDLLAELSISLCVSVIDHLLNKHKTVHAIICEGNHDEAGSVWLRKAVKRHYANEKRVTIDDTSFPFYAYLHGETLLGFHHGHKVKNKSLPGLFAAEPRYRPLWGRATRTYIHTGHYHRTEQDRAEDGGAVVERHNTLAARDAYATRGGWVSNRNAQAITYHKTDGEVSRVVVVPKYEKGEKA
jgi:hypothetical protein